MFVSSWMDSIIYWQKDKTKKKLEFDAMKEYHAKSQSIRIRNNYTCIVRRLVINFVFISSYNSTHPILDAWELCKIRHCRLYSWADIPSHRPRCRPCYSSWWSWEAPNRDQYNPPSIPGHESFHKSLLQTPKTTRCVWSFMRFTNPWMVPKGRRKYGERQPFLLAKTNSCILATTFIELFRFWASGMMESNATALQ